MGRLHQILNVLVVAIGAIIAWNEHRDRRRPQQAGAATEPPGAEPPGRAPTTPAEPPAPTKAAGEAAVPTGEPAVPAGAIAGDGTNQCPPDHPIKGNADSMIYHLPGRPSYERTIPEFCFATAEAAEAAGFRPPRR